MKVLLIEPAKFFAEESMNKIIKQTPHIGLAYLATVTKLRGHEVKVIDVPAVGCDIGWYVDFLKSWAPDFVGFSAMTHNILEAYKFAHHTKAVNPNIRTVIGGPHANAVPIQTLEECDSLNIAVFGEGEITFPELIDTNKLSDVDGIAYRSGGKVVKNRPRAPIMDLDDLPFPDWGLYNYQTDYAKAYSYKFKEMRHIYSINTMRGCPFDCVFCSPHGLGPGARFRSAENIFAEIKRNVDEYGGTFFYLADSNSTLKRSQIEGLCEMILDEGLDIAWKCETHVNAVDKALLRLMRRAGCELIFYGIESGNRHIQKKIKKNLNLDRVRSIVLVTNEAGMKVRAGFIIGLPYDTRDTVNETLEFARFLQLEQACFSLLDIYPGPEVEKMLERGEGGMSYLGGIKPRWDEVERADVNVEVNDLKKGDLLRYYDEAYHIIHPKSLSSRMHKFLTEHHYYYENYPSILLRHTQNNLAVIEACLRLTQTGSLIPSKGGT